MGNAWDELLAQNESLTGSEETIATAAVIYSPSSETLHQFSTICFPEGTASLLDTKLISYAAIGWTNGLQQHYGLDIYTLIKNSTDTLDLIKPFLQEHTSKIHWFILLNWSLNDQKQWLCELFDTFGKIRSLNDDNEFSIWCLNSSEIFDLQRNTTTWQSAHIDFIMQTLRSFCYFNGSSLFYICGGGKGEEEEEEEEEAQRFKYQEILKRVIEGGDMKDCVEMVKRSRISIPRGCDSIGLIKTIDERFEPNEVKDAQFLTRYMDFVPAMDGIKDNRIRCNDVKNLHPLGLFQVNIQDELRKMFIKHKESSKI